MKICCKNLEIFIINTYLLINASKNICLIKQVKYIKYVHIFVNRITQFQMVRIIENYTLYEVIGQGAYGKVFRATNKLDNRQYAVKVIEVKKFQSNKKLQQCTVNQINILTNIEKNQHIIQYYDMLKTQNNFYFIYEYCNGGTLQGQLRKQQMLDERNALLILRQLLQAFKLLNKYNIMHRDLKPDNIFFHNGVLKVGDFGFCKSLEKTKMAKTMLGSPIYMAPEILKGQIYSTKADIWSIGVVLYEMLYGFCPFESTSIPKLIQVLNETELQFPDNIVVSSETKNLLRRILTKDPTKRIQWMQLFQQKISNDGKLNTDDTSKKLYRQVSETTTDEKKNYSYTSPKNVGGPDMFAKKGTYEVPRPEVVNESPNMRKVKSNNQSLPLGVNKQRIITSHNQILKGLGIAKNLSLSNQRSSPTFSYYIFKHILDKLHQLTDQLENVYEGREIVQIFSREISEIDSEMMMIKAKVDDTSDWKKNIKAKIDEIRNIRLSYQLVMFLSNEPIFEGLTTMEMQNSIRSSLI